MEKTLTHQWVKTVSTVLLIPRFIVKIKQVIRVASQSDTKPIHSGDV